MQLLMIKIISDIICGVLNFIGGYCWHNARRFIMPCVVALTVSYVSRVWWLGIGILPVMGTLCIGYFGGRFIGRGLWLALQAFVFGIVCFFTNHLYWYFYLPYVLGAFFLGGSLFDIEEVIGDLIFGCWLGSIVFIIH